jgi:hypothetical protein
VEAPSVHADTRRRTRRQRLAARQAVAPHPWAAGEAVDASGGRTTSRASAGSQRGQALGCPRFGQARDRRVRRPWFSVSGDSTRTRSGSTTRIASGGATSRPVPALPPCASTWVAPCASTWVAYSRTRGETRREGKLVPMRGRSSRFRGGLHRTVGVSSRLFVRRLVAWLAIASAALLIAPAVANAVFELSGHTSQGRSVRLRRSDHLSKVTRFVISWRRLSAPAAQHSSKAAANGPWSSHSRFSFQAAALRTLLQSGRRTPPRGLL